MIRKLISEISQQLDIPQSSSSDSLCRAIYSATGKMVLASLWDHPENEDSVSVQHFKNRAFKVLTAYISIYPEIKSRFPSDLSTVVEDIYQTYRRNGFFYHSSYRLSPAVPSISKFKQYALYRGYPPQEQLFMSGLGFFDWIDDSKSYSSVEDMFSLQTQTFSYYISELLIDDNWTEAEWTENAEFLRLTPPFSKGYWQAEPDKTENTSLARYGGLNKTYVFYRWKNNHFEQKPIPAWRLDDFRTIGQPGCEEYRRIACGLLSAAHTLPPIHFKMINSQLVYIKLGYRLPPGEEDFFRLYSWPISYKPDGQPSGTFQREMSHRVFPVFKYLLESIGYSFIEL